MEALLKQELNEGLANKKEQFLVQFEIVGMNAVKCREKMVGSRNALR